MPSDKIEKFFDIEKAVEEWGLIMYERNARSKKQRKMKRKHFVNNEPCIDVQIDWSHMSTTHKTIWGQIKDLDMKSSLKGQGQTNEAGDTGSSARAADVTKADANILFQTDFTNDTEEKQEYTLKIEKTTRSTCTTEIENGVTKGIELGATLNVGDVLEIGTQFSREVSLTKMEGETLEQEVTWGAESTIVVPKGKAASAVMKIIEKQQSGDFTVLTTMRGYVKIKYVSLKDNSLLFSQTGKVDFIVKEYIKEMKSIGKIFQGIEYGEDGSVTFQTKGNCTFRFGVKQVVKVVQDP